MEYEALLYGYSVFPSLIYNSPDAMSQAMSSGLFSNFIGQFGTNFFDIIVLLLVTFTSFAVFAIITFTVLYRIIMPLFRAVALIK